MKIRSEYLAYTDFFSYTMLYPSSDIAIGAIQEVGVVKRVGIETKYVVIKSFNCYKVQIIFQNIKESLLLS